MIRGEEGACGPASCEWRWDGQLFAGTFDSKLLESELLASASTLAAGLGYDIEIPPFLLDLPSAVLEGPGARGAS